MYRNRSHSGTLGYFTEAKTYFDQAKDKDVQSSPEQIEWIVKPLLQIVDDILQKSTKATLAVTFQGDTLNAMAFSIIVLIVVLTTLQGISYDLLVINNFIEAIAAILFGFGSPAFLKCSLLLS